MTGDFSSSPRICEALHYFQSECRLGRRTADPADGKLEVVLVPKLGPAEIAMLAAQIVLGKHLSSNATIFRQARKVAVRSRPGMWFNVDGELVGNAPTVFQIMPRALNFIVK